MSRSDTIFRRYVNRHLEPLKDDKYQGLLSDAEKQELYRMADGFAETPDYWDWSHIRDASDAAIRRIAYRIAEIVGDDATKSAAMGAHKEAHDQRMARR